MDAFGVDDVVGLWAQIPTGEEQFNLQNNWNAQLQRPSEYAQPSSRDNRQQVIHNPNPQLNQNQNNRNTLFFKTRLCGKYKAGACPYGSRCSFAHGNQELRRAPPNWQDIIAAAEEEKKDIWKQGRSHGREGYPLQQQLRESSAISLLGSNTAPAIPGGDGATGSHQRVGYMKWKSCHGWDATGYCSFGATCNFAHGNAELMRSGGNMELGCTKAGADPSNAKSEPPNDDSLDDTDPICKHQAPKTNFLKWKDPKKISRIYADWIEGIPAPTIHTSQ